MIELIHVAMLMCMRKLYGMHGRRSLVICWQYNYHIFKNMTVFLFIDLSWNGPEPECCGVNSPSKFCFSHEIDGLLVKLLLMIT